MQTYWSGAHRGHRPEVEVGSGGPRAHVEAPERADGVLAAVREAGLGPVDEVVVDEGAVRAAAERVHDGEMVGFLASAWRDWVASGRDGQALPVVWPVPGLRFGPEQPESVEGRLSRWCFDAGTPIVAGTWGAAIASAACALAAADAVAGGGGPAFALCRPPGHHAAPGAFGGYCYLNNAALAAERLRARGAERVAVLDVDYHHGNGTQAVFWERADVLTVSIHADPRHDYPYFSGHASEVGAGAGEGANRNLPLPRGTGWAAWSEALGAGAGAVAAFGADALVVPLGVDTYAGDPISHFRLGAGDYPRIGERVAALGLPTVVVLEGGYAVEAIGANVAGALRGLAGG